MPAQDWDCFAEVDLARPVDCSSVNGGSAGGAVVVLEPRPPRLVRAIRAGRAVKHKAGDNRLAHRRARKRDVWVRPAAHVKIVGNLPQITDKATTQWLGRRLPRREVLAQAPPVAGATAITGPMGAGKSALMSRMARTWQRRGQHATEDRNKVELWTTGMNIAGEDRHFDGGGDVGRALIHLARALDERATLIPWDRRPWVVVAMDEMAVQADSRDWAGFPKSLAAQMTQIRKYRIIPYYTAVFWERVDSLVRDFTGWVWHVEMTTPTLGFGGGTIVAKCWPPDAERKEDERPKQVMRMRLRRGDVQVFDTGNIVKKARNTADADEARALVSEIEQAKKVQRAKDQHAQMLETG